jgi:hypothetical protein
MLGIFATIEEASETVADIIASGIGPTSLVRSRWRRR